MGGSKDSSSEDLTLPTTPTTTQPPSTVTSAELSTPPKSSSAQHDGDNTPYTPGKMFVGGLSWETTDDGLRAYFSKYGEIADCVVMRDTSTNRSRGFGFVTFVVAASTEAVLAETHTLDNKIIDPKLAVPREFKPSPLGSDFKTKKLFIGGISPTTTEESLRKYFAQFGNVVEALLMIDRETQRPRGFGFVTFENEAAAEVACQQKFHEIDHKANVEVKKAEPKSSRTRGESRVPSRPRGSSSAPVQEYAAYPAYAASFSPQPAPPPGFASSFSASPAGGYGFSGPFVNPYGFSPVAAGGRTYTSGRPFARGSYGFVNAVPAGYAASPAGSAAAAGSPSGPARNGAPPTTTTAAAAAAASGAPAAYALYDEYYDPSAVGMPGMTADRNAIYAQPGYAMQPATVYGQPVSFARPPRGFQAYGRS